MVFSFVICLFIFLGIGILSVLRRKKSSVDYYLANRKVNPWMVGLSAYATGNSGWMFIAQTSYTYLYGISSMWLLFFWPLGDYAASLIFHKKFRAVTEKQDLISYGEIMTQWHDKKSRPVLRFIVGVMIVIFLGLYAAAQFKAGSKALYVIFDWPEHWGALIGAFIVLVYSWGGGVRATIWTDIAQGLLMILSMGGLFFFSVYTLGGWSSFVEALYKVSPSYMSWFPQDILPMAFLGPLLFLSGWFFAGIGVVGQPHIMTRFMTLNDPKNISKARLAYYPSIYIFSCFCLGVGLAARLIFPHQGFDTELVFPLLSVELLPQIFVGIMLAGVFSSSMSTADSQVLSCSSSLTKDVLQLKTSHYISSKLSTVFICLMALTFALFAKETVFSLVLLSWSVLSAAFTPILLLYVFGQRPSEKEMILLMFVSVGLSIFCRQWENVIYPLAPAILGGLLYYFIFHKLLGPSIRKTLE